MVTLSHQRIQRSLPTVAGFKVTAWLHLPSAGIIGFVPLHPALQNIDLTVSVSSHTLLPTLNPAVSSISTQNLGLHPTLAGTSCPLLHVWIFTSQTAPASPVVRIQQAVFDTPQPVHPARVPQFSAHLISPNRLLVWGCPAQCTPTQLSVELVKGMA